MFTVKKTHNTYRMLAVINNSHKKGTIARKTFLQNKSLHHAIHI